MNQPENKDAQQNKTETTPTPQISTQELFGDSQQIHIVHGEEVYCLRITKNNKLILNK